MPFCYHRLDSIQSFEAVFEAFHLTHHLLEEAIHDENTLLSHCIVN